VGFVDTVLSCPHQYTSPGDCVLPSRAVLDTTGRAVTAIEPADHLDVRRLREQVDHGQRARSTARRQQRDIAANAPDHS
jgi:hypothetical protein